MLPLGIGDCRHVFAGLKKETEMRGLTATRRFRLALSVGSALVLAVAPYHFALHGPAAGIVASKALAKSGGNGGGNGNSGGGNSGNGNGGNGNGGNGNSGNGNSGNGNSGNGNGNSSAGSGNGNGDSSGGNSANVNAATGGSVKIDGDNISVEHPDGFLEEIDHGRYKMKDALGRMIVNRPATAADIRRLRGS